MGTKFEDYACADDCERLAEMEEERDTWVRAAEMLAHRDHIHMEFGWINADHLAPPSKRDEHTRKSNEADLAAAYAIASLGEDWREKIGGYDAPSRASFVVLPGNVRSTCAVAYWRQADDNAHDADADDPEDVRGTAAITRTGGTSWTLVISQEDLKKPNRPLSSRTSA